VLTVKISSFFLWESQSKDQWIQLYFFALLHFTPTCGPFFFNVFIEHTPLLSAVLHAVSIIYMCFTFFLISLIVCFLIITPLQCFKVYWFNKQITYLRELSVWHWVIQDWSLAQRNRTECGVSECDRKSSITKRTRPSGGCCARERKTKTVV
jgi:hypothetical protein